MCGNTGCPSCNDVGTFELTECPKKVLPNDIWQFIDYADMYEKGIPPEPGGTLDQLHSFNYYCRFIWNEKAIHKAKAGMDMMRF